jgi:hypothetical protein
MRVLGNLVVNKGGRTPVLAEQMPPRTALAAIYRY